MFILHLEFVIENFIPKPRNRITKLFYDYTCLKTELCHKVVQLFYKTVISYDYHRFKCFRLCYNLNDKWSQLNLCMKAFD